MMKMYSASIHCSDCEAGLSRRVDRSVHPKTVKHDTEMLFKTKYDCPHDVAAKVETIVLTSDVVRPR